VESNVKKLQEEMWNIPQWFVPQALKATENTGYMCAK
jgi:hypothetical protein